MQLQQPDPLSAVSSIVHDLRNPLASIQAGAEMLVRTRFSQPQVDRIARKVYSASVRMRELLEEFLEQGRGLERKVEPCDLGDLVAAAVTKMAVSAEFQSVRIVQAVPQGLTIALDRHRMLQVLVNVLVNALEAMPNGGSIFISAVSNSRWTLIGIRDTGPGIAPEVRDRLFEPFATAKPNGMGLGLAFSRQAVIDLGGDMWAESSHQGACFSIRLPRKSSTLLAGPNL